MQMKGKGTLTLLIIFVATVAAVALSYFGIGSKHILGISNIKQGLDLSGGAYIVYEAEKENPSANEMKSAISLIRDRLDRKGYTEAEVAAQGSKRIRVDIPGVEDADKAIAEIGQTAQLLFVDPDGKVVLTGSDVADAKKDVGTTKQGGIAEPYVSLTFTEQGKKAFAEATSRLIGKQISIVLDNGIISAPTVNDPITDGKAIISGSFTAQGAEDLAALIRAGSLPFNLKVLEMNNIGAKLGANALSSSILAGIIGTVLVLLFMAFIYRLPGLAADWALILYTGLLLLVLSLFRVTLTLPGIAGIILSIGMAVDANVIIFERMKEEVAAGKTVRVAIDAGFERALPAILDSNVTTIIAAVVLYFLGTGPIKGFAQTLIIGIIISMFTALFITRSILKGLSSSGINNPKLYTAR